MKTNSKIYVSGHTGLVGSALVRELRNQGYSNLVLRTRQELDLLNQQSVYAFFEQEQPDYVFLAAAKVGGILANRDRPADFCYDNLTIQNNVLYAAHSTGVTKLLFLGSSCIYPKHADQPIAEQSLLSGPLEETNAPYAVAKIAGITLCQSFKRQYNDNFIAAMPTNLYGPHDNFDLHSSHVLPALIRKFHDARDSNTQQVTLWGTGTPKREFMHVQDMASACIFLMNHYDDIDIINIGTGEDISIEQLAILIKEITQYQGDIVWDTSKPDGAPRKLLDVSRLSDIGFTPKIDLQEGISQTYQWYCENL